MTPPIWGLGPCMAQAFHNFQKAWNQPSTVDTRFRSKERMLFVCPLAFAKHAEHALSGLIIGQPW